jgi:hypothetical protein
MKYKEAAGLRNQAKFFYPTMAKKKTELPK